MINLFKSKKRISKRMDTHEKIMDYLLSDDSKAFRVYIINKVIKYFNRYGDVFFLGFTKILYYKHNANLSREEIEQVFKMDFEEAKNDFKADGKEKYDWFVLEHYQRYLYLNYLITKQ